MEKNKEEQVQENQPSSEIEQDHKRKTPSISKDMIKVNEITPETKKSLKQRTITALLLVAIVVPPIILGDWPFVIGLFIFSLIAIYEFINVLASKKFPLIVDIFTFIMTLSFIFWIAIKPYVQDSSWPFLYIRYSNIHFRCGNISINFILICFVLF